MRDVPLASDLPVKPAQPLPVYPQGDWDDAGGGRLRRRFEFERFDEKLCFAVQAASATHDRGIEMKLLLDGDAVTVGFEPEGPGDDRPKRGARICDEIRADIARYASAE